MTLSHIGSERTCVWLVIKDHETGALVQTALTIWLKDRSEGDIKTMEGESRIILDLQSDENGLTNAFYMQRSIFANHLVLEYAPEEPYQSGCITLLSDDSLPSPEPPPETRESFARVDIEPPKTHVQPAPTLVAAAEEDEGTADEDTDESEGYPEPNAEEERPSLPEGMTWTADGYPASAVLGPVENNDSFTAPRPLRTGLSNWWLVLPIVFVITSITWTIWLIWTNWPR